MYQTVTALIALMRLNKPIGIWLLLWPVLWALCLCYHGIPPVRLLSLFVMGVVITRSLGCVINDFFDRDIDKQVARTRMRPLATEMLSERTVVLTVLLLASLALMVVYLLNARLWGFGLCCLGAMTVYPLCKRVMQVPQFFLAIVFSLGIPFVYLYAQGSITNECVCLFFINSLWVVSYDTYYAIGDLSDDLRLGVFSSAVAWGNQARHYTLCFQLTMALIWFGLFLKNNASLVTYGLWALAHTYLLRLWWRYHHKCSAMSPLAVFRQGHWYGGIMLLTLWIMCH